MRVRAAGGDRPDDLMAGNDLRQMGTQFAFDDMQVRPADAADLDLDQDLSRPRFRNGQIPEF
jgi:hypothetical protein